MTTVTNVSWWISLADGLAGVDLLTLAPSQTLPLAPGQAGARVEGLQYDISGEPRVTYREFGKKAHSGCVHSTMAAMKVTLIVPHRGSFLGGEGVPAAADVRAA